MQNNKIVCRPVYCLYLIGDPLRNQDIHTGFSWRAFSELFLIQDQEIYDEDSNKIDFGALICGNVNYI
jgi:hypothetical protein